MKQLRFSGEHITVILSTDIRPWPPTELGRIDIRENKEGGRNIVIAFDSFCGIEGWPKMLRHAADKLERKEAHTMAPKKKTAKKKPKKPVAPKPM